MLFHRKKSLVVGFTILTLSLAAQAQSDSQVKSSSSDRLSLPSSRSRYEADPAPSSWDEKQKKYNFEKDITDESHDLPPVFNEVRGAAIFGSNNHSFQVEHHSIVPLARAEDLDGLLFMYEHQDYTPFARDNGGSQVESVTNFDNLRLEYEISDDIALKAIGGYDTYQKVDRMGAVGGYRGGIGIGSNYEDNLEDLRWEVMAGGLSRSETLKANWFLDADVSYRLVEITIGKSPQNTEFNPSLLLELREQSTNDGGKYHYYVEGGPTLEVLSVNNNRFSFYVHYFRNSHDEFQMVSDHGAMAGIQGTTFTDMPQNFSYDWDFKGVRWIPRMWGKTEFGGSPGGTMRKVRVYLDAWDVSLADQVVSVYTDYEHRQDQISDLNSTSFSVAAGGKTYIDPKDSWFSVVTDGQHLVPFAEYFHRSDHALNVGDINRLQPTTTSNGYLRRMSTDILEAGFQTLGWGNPNYRTDKFQDDTKFVNEWDWMIKVGYATTSQRHRAQPPAQAGINWDMASVHGFVFYMQGIVSTGEASPDYLAELGIKRPEGNVFIRLENYGLPARLEDENKPVYVGLGLNL